MSGARDRRRGPASAAALGWRGPRRRVPAGTVRRARASLAAAVAALVILAGCSTTSGRPLPAGTADAPVASTAPSAPAAGAAEPIGSPEAVARFGYGPPPLGTVDYEDDVVPIGTGPDAIKAVSTDWTSYTLDGSAPGVADLDVGKILFASSTAVGRIVELSRDGDDVVARIAPIELTELLKSGSFDFQTELDPNAFNGRQFDESAGWITDGEKGTELDMPPGLRGPGGSALQGPGLAVGPGGPSFEVLTGKPPTAGDQVSVGQWTAKPTFTTNQVGLEMIYNKADLIVDSSVQLKTDHLNFSVTGDPRHGDFSMVLRGVRGVTLDLQAGLGPGADPASGNRKIEGELPLSWTIPLYAGPPLLGIPVALQVGFTFNVATALGAKNATIHARGDYGLTGDIGIIKGAVQAPGITVNESLLNMDGISLTASGLVVGVTFKLMLGVGIPQAMAGPHMFFTASAGIAKGTQIAINADCRFASLDFKAGAGFSLSVSPWVEKLLKSYVKLTRPLNAAKETVVFHEHREGTEPKVAACSLAG